jgi:hypothetical protein
MRDNTGQSTSVWMATATTPSLPILTGDSRVDVCVVGAGIAGITTAYMLARAGKTVAGVGTIQGRAPDPDVGLQARGLDKP